MFIALHKERDHVVVVGRPLRFGYRLRKFRLDWLRQDTPLWVMDVTQCSEVSAHG